MFSYVWPIALVVLSNTVYQICSKSMPPEVHPFASLTVTYLVGAVLSGVMFFVLNPGGNLLREYGKLNWAPFALGIVIVGLEVGFVYAYKAGWQVNTAAIAQAIHVRAQEAADILLSAKNLLSQRNEKKDLQRLSLGQSGTTKATGPTGQPCS